METRAVIAQGAEGETTSRWSDAGVWRGDGLRREVFFFGSRGIELYGSLYAAAEPSRPFGVVACSSWGVEADRSDPLVRSVALGMARLGGAGLVFHYPGYGDSYGDLSAVDFSDLAEAAADAIAEASRRCPEVTWIAAGFMLGAAVACAARRSARGGLLLVQPALRPGRYFQWLAEYGKRRPLRFGVTEGMAYGYPLPSRMLSRAAELDAAAESALAELDGAVTVIRYAEPDGAEVLPGHAEQIEVPGRWRFGSKDDPELAEAATDWLERRTAEAGAGEAGK